MVLEKVGVLVVITNRSGWLLELLTELRPLLLTDFGLQPSAVSTIDLQDQVKRSAPKI